MEVIGEDGMVYDVDDDDVEGDVLGDVLGYSGPMGDYEADADAVYGYGDDGYPLIVGAAKRRKRKRRGGHLVRVKKPRWRRSQLAPGVIAPDQGLLPLPMAGNPSNTFTATLNNITFEGQLQKPFRGERLLVSVTRTGTSATGRLLAQLFVGTDLNQLDVPQFDAEQVGDPTAFGVRLAMKPAQPGVFIRLVTSLSTALTSTDTIVAYVTILGRNLH